MKSKLVTLAMAVALAACTVPAFSEDGPIPKVFHLHPNSTDSRVRFTVFNHAARTYDVRIADQVYSVKPHYLLNITAPTGTPVYAATDMATHKNGELLQEIKSTDRSKMLILF